MAKQEYVFEAKASVVTTVIGGKSVEVTKDGPAYRTKDPDEAAVLRELDGLKEVTEGGKN